MNFSANLSLLYPDLPFLDRFAAASAAGFRGVEHLFALEWPLPDLAAQLGANGLQQTLMNIAPGDWAAGDRGLACLPDRRDDFSAGLDAIIEYARELDCRTLHCVAGVVPAGLDQARAQSCFIDNVRMAAGRCAQYGIKVLIEPINPYDMPGFFLSDFGQAIHLLERIEEMPGPAAGLQFDIYHCARIYGAGRVVDWIDRCARWIGYFQIAGVPDRHEPDVGVLPVDTILMHVRRGFAHTWIGCEYHPRGETVAGLTWMDGY